jgi:hypothetical protein
MGEININISDKGKGSFGTIAQGEDITVTTNQTIDLSEADREKYNVGVDQLNRELLALSKLILTSEGINDDTSGDYNLELLSLIKELKATKGKDANLNVTPQLIDRVKKTLSGAQSVLKTSETVYETFSPYVKAGLDIITRLSSLFI